MATTTGRWFVRVKRPDSPWTDPVLLGERCLLNEGITRLLNLLIGGGGTTYARANSRVGAGNGTTGPNPSQTGLVGGSSVYQAVDVSYPVIAGQTVTWRVTFAAGIITFEVCELVVDNGAGPGEDLDREVLAAADRFTPGVGDIVQFTFALTIG